MENPLQFSPTVFDPNKEQLHAIAEEVRSITADPEKMTKEDLELINSTKNKLVKARTSIEKAGKAAREAANKYNKDVIAYEDELIAIILPEEKRLKELEAAAKEHAMKQERLKTLPEFKEKLASIGDNVEISDEELLKMDPNQRDVYYNTRLGAKLEADKAAADAKRAEEDAARQAEEKRIADEKAENDRKAKELEERAYNIRVQQLLTLGFKEEGGLFVYANDIVSSKQEVRQLEDGAWNAYIERAGEQVAKHKKAAEENAKREREAELKATEERAKKEAEEKAEADRKAEEDRKRAEEERVRDEQLKRDAEKAFDDWKRKQEYNPETDIIQYENGKSTIYRKLAEYIHQ